MKKQYKHLTLDDRTLIQTQLQQGFKPAQIADSLNRPRSCISRELARNVWKAPPIVRSVGQRDRSGLQRLRSADPRNEPLRRYHAIFV